MKKLSSGIFFLAALALVSCKEDDPKATDTEAPVITLSEPAGGDEFEAGSDIHFEATFEDNMELATANVTVHHNFDGHSHGRLAVTRFSFDKSYPLSGTKQEMHEHIAIPSDAAAGPYHFIVKAVDKSGNATGFDNGSTKEAEIWITNKEMAVVKFRNSAGNETDHFHGSVNEKLVFRGDIKGVGSNLQEVNVVIGTAEEGHDHEHDHARVKLETPVFSKSFPLADKPAEKTLEALLAAEDIRVTQAQLTELQAKDEELYLIVRVTDVNGNIARYKAPVEFGDH